jgi:hypothetical protein
MFTELTKYVEYKTQRLVCAGKVNLHAPQSYTPHTIEAQARMGVRFPSMWSDLLKKHIYYNSTMNEILDVEFDVAMDVRIERDGQEEMLKKFQLRNRMIYHRSDGYIRLIAKPLLLDPEGKCTGVFVIDDMCSCFK